MYQSKFNSSKDFWLIKYTLVHDFLMTRKPPPQFPKKGTAQFIFSRKLTPPQHLHSIFWLVLYLEDNFEEHLSQGLKVLQSQCTKYFVDSCVHQRYSLRWFRLRALQPKGREQSSTFDSSLQDTGHAGINELLLWKQKDNTVLQFHWNQMTL